MRAVHAVLILAGAFALSACQTPSGAAHANSVTRAIADMSPTNGNTARGVVLFIAEEGGVRIVAEIEGLDPGQQHAIHIHETGDCSSGDGKSAGGHYNPEGHDHALPDHSERHAGDLGNLTADENGVTRYELWVDNVTINGKHNPILGRGVIIHAKADDGGQPTGNAGARISCGVIGPDN